MTQFLSPKDLDDAKIDKSILSSNGDILIKDGTGNLAPLPVGNQGQVLTVGLSSTPEWADPISGGGVGLNYGTIDVGGVLVDATADSDTLTLIAGSNVTLTPNVGAKSVTIASTAGGLASNTFLNIVAAGNTSTAATTTDTFTFTAGSNIGLTHVAGSKSLQIAVTGTVPNATTAVSISGTITGSQVSSAVANATQSADAQTHIAQTGTSAHSATPNNSPNQIVARDASGNFTANQITASTFVGTLSGNATSATTATNFSGNISGSQVTSAVANATTASNCTGNAATVTTNVGNVAGNAGNTPLTLVVRDASGSFNATNIGLSGTLTGNVTGNCSGSSGSCTGNAATATNATNHIGATGSAHGLATSSVAGFMSAADKGNMDYMTIFLGGTTGVNKYYTGCRIMTGVYTSNIAPSVTATIYFPYTFNYVGGLWFGTCSPSDAGNTAAEIYLRQISLTTSQFQISNVSASVTISMVRWFAWAYQSEVSI